MHRWFTPLMILALACKPGDDTDTDPSTEIDTEVDTEAPFSCDALTLEAELTDTDGRTLPPGPFSAALFAISVSDDLALPAEASWATEARADGLFQLCIGTPDDADYLDQDPDSTTRVATYVVGAWADLDGDAYPGLGDPTIGVTATLMVYIDGTPPADEIFEDMTEGWNTLTLTSNGFNEPTTEGATVANNLVETDIPANLRPLLHDGLDATMVPNLESEVTVVLTQLDERDGELLPGAETVVDATSENASFVIDGPFRTAPPLSQQFPFDEGSFGLSLSLYAATAVTTGPGPRGFNPGASSLFAATPKAVMYVGASSLVDGLYLNLYDWNLGWSLVTFDLRRGDSPDSFVPVDWDEGIELDTPQFAAQ